MSLNSNPLTYESLLARIMVDGERVEQRARLADNSLPYCRSLIGEQIKYNLDPYFPLITSKRVSWKAVVHELIWILKGSGNINYLEKNGVTIWDEWADEDGDLGPVYPTQWRKWVNARKGYTDQVKELERNIEHVLAYPNHHAARRLIITSWNPGDMPSPKVPTGCHTLVQFFIRGNTLHSHLYMRSCDAFLGLPFNLASYGLLTRVLATRHKMQAGQLTISFGDVHIYSNHFDQVDTLLKRDPRVLPVLIVDDNVKLIDDLSDMTPEMVPMFAYYPHGSLPGEVAI